MCVGGAGRGGAGPQAKPLHGRMKGQRNKLEGGMQAKPLDSQLCDMQHGQEGMWGLGPQVKPLRGQV
jgi:hypothetical protein